MHSIAQTLHTEQPRINAALDAEATRLPGLVRPVGEYTLNAGGKRLRPLLAVVTAKALGCDHDDIYLLAAAVELFHAATLLHDDVLDNAATRRGVAAAHIQFGAHTAILAGDAMLARAAGIVARLDDMRLGSAFAEAVVQTAAGELAEFAAMGKIPLPHSEYIAVITGKTAWALRVACEMAAIRAGAPPDLVAAAARFGLELGIAFQMVDDALDITPSRITGKPAGGDLRERKCTPLIRFYWESLAPEQAAAFAAAFAAGAFTDGEMRDILDAMRRQGLDERTRALADTHLACAEQALAIFPAGKHKDILGRVPEYIRARAE